MGKKTDRASPELLPVQPDWGKPANDNFGYASNEERLTRRGMEDWELTEKIPQSQKKIPYWFIAVVVTVLLVAVGLGFPFWGNRPGVHPDWFNWGFVAAIFYVAAAATFVYFMTQLYGSSSGGRLDSDDNETDPVIPPLNESTPDNAVEQLISPESE